MYIKKFNESLFTQDRSLKDYEKLLIKAVVSYMKETFDFEAKIIAKKKLPNDHTFGYLNLNDNAILKNKFHIYVQTGYHRYMLGNLIHEITHCKQVVKKELLPSDDYKSLMWKGNEYITVHEYKKLIKSKDLTKYRELPWEREAYDNQENLIDDFIESKHLENLKGKNVTLDFIIENL